MNQTYRIFKNYLVIILIASGFQNLHARGVYSVFEAARTGDTGKIQKYIDQGHNVNLANHGGETPLLIASYEGHFSIVKLLIENGADVNHRDDYNFTALMNACMEGHLKIVRFLMEKGADIHIQNAHKWNAYMIAVRENFPEIAFFLKSKGAVWPDGPELKMDFIEQAKKGNLEFIKQCIRNGNVNVNDRILYGRMIPWDLILPEVIIRNMDGLTALHQAVRSNHYEVAKFLLENGADPEVVEYETGLTAMDMAQSNENEDLVNLLLQYGLQY